jgi:predicted NAD-dependent protein-ADP-ribosyltransferase YbiA (DUF1768 family)
MERIFNFNGRSIEGGVLSNFHTGVVEIDGKKYPSGEATFQGSKYLEASKNSSCLKRKADLIEYSEKFQVGGEFAVLPPGKIKGKGGKKGMALSVEDLKNWTETGEALQRKICRYKFEHEAKVVSCLKNHMTDILVHPSRVSDNKIGERIWEGRGKIVEGKVVVLGGNVLGKLWMEIRDEFLV